MRLARLIISELQCIGCEAPPLDSEGGSMPLELYYIEIEIDGHSFEEYLLWWPQYLYLSPR